MLRVLIICGLALLALPLSALRAAAAECPAAPVQPLSLPATAATMAAGRPVSILAFGSSSTEGFAASSPEASYPARLQARLRAALPGHLVTVLNRGRGGEEVAEMMRRLKRDVLEASPTLVIWQVGSNAVLRAMPPALYRERVEAGLDRLRAAGIEVVLMDNQEAPKLQAWPEGNAQILAQTAGIAHDRGVPLFSRSALMRRWQGEGVPTAAVIGPDGLHHTDLGYDCVAAALADSILAALRPVLSPAAEVADAGRAR
ncbi:SGNH/GDSL hydrolase family protein [Roseomonas sp. KE2513]|nr:SGNH/GDSL hydrolase family protein [Roseomonas sp. KE2513]